jgi:hypothetical protein
MLMGQRLTEGNAQIAYIPVYMRILSYARYISREGVLEGRTAPSQQHFPPTKNNTLLIHSTNETLTLFYQNMYMQSNYVTNL